MTNYKYKHTSFMWDVMKLANKPKTLKPYIEEAKKVGKIPWSASICIEIALLEYFNYTLESETYEETMLRRGEEIKL